MKPAERQLVLDTLTKDSPPPANLLKLERLGNDAFDFIVALLKDGKLKALQRRNAIRRLALLTRHQCFDRTDELLSISLDEMRSDDRCLRSGATICAVVAAQILTRSPNWISSPRFLPGAEPSLADVVKSAVQEALGLELDPGVEKFARQFLELAVVVGSDDDLLIASMRAKATQSVDPKVTAIASERRVPATAAAVRAAEDKLGRSLDPFLRRVYLEVTSGGFGPGYGALPLSGADSLPSTYESFLIGDQWPADLLPVRNWGDAIWSCVDSAGKIVTHDGAVGPTLTAFDVRTWLRSWVDGVQLWDQMYEDREVEITNPFTRRPVKTKVHHKVKGLPWTPP